VRIYSGSILWDLAVRDTDKSGALQFRYNGADAKRVTISTAGELTAPIVSINND